MRKLVRYLGTAAVALTGWQWGSAQSPAGQQAPAAAQTDSCAATPTLEALTRALDAAVSGPGNKDRACMRALFLPEARLIPVAKGKDGQIATHVLTLDGWIDRVKQRGDTPFYERQVSQKVESFGHIAHLWSTYELRETPDAKPEVRGINSIQAIHDGQNWRVIEIVWETETPGQDLPGKYLP